MFFLFGAVYMVSGDGPATPFGLTKSPRCQIFGPNPSELFVVRNSTEIGVLRGAGLPEASLERTDFTYRAGPLKN